MCQVWKGAKESLPHYLYSTLAHSGRWKNYLSAFHCDSSNCHRPHLIVYYSQKTKRILKKESMAPVWQNGLFEFFCRFHRFLTTRGLFFKSDFYASSTISSSVSRTDSSQEQQWMPICLTWAWQIKLQAYTLNATNCSEAGEWGLSCICSLNCQLMSQYCPETANQPWLSKDCGQAGLPRHASLQGLSGEYPTSKLHPP